MARALREELKGALNYRFKIEYIYDESGNWIKRKKLYWDYDRKKFYEGESWYRKIVYW